MRTAPVLLIALLTSSVVACDSAEDTPEETHRIIYAGEEVESLDDVPEEMHELAYEVWEQQKVNLEDGITLRAACTANCEHGDIHISGDVCSCDDSSGCTATKNDITVFAPCPTRKGAGAQE